jgi:hypothetical protein
MFYSFERILFRVFYPKAFALKGEGVRNQAINPSAAGGHGSALLFEPSSTKWAGRWPGWPGVAEAMEGRERPS